MAIPGSDDRSGSSRRWLRFATVLLLLLSGLAAFAVAPAGAAPGFLPSVGKKEQLGSAVALSRVNGTEMAFVGAPARAGETGIVYVYTGHGTDFRRSGAIPNPAGFDASFGQNLSAVGRTVAITGNFKVWVYHQAGTHWRHEATLTGAPEAFEVEMSSSTLAISDFTHSEVAVYSRRGGRFSLQAILHGPFTFGAALAVSGSTVAIGSDGTVWVYAKSGSRWVRQAKLTAFGNFYGEAVAVSGSTLVVGAFAAYRHYIGLAYIYQRSAGRWHQVARFKEPTPTRNDAFGTTTAASGRRVLVGAPSDVAPTGTTRRCGSAYEFVKSAGRWRYQAKVVNPGCTSGDEFSQAMAIQGDTAMIGAPAKNHDHGAVYVLRVP